MKNLFKIAAVSIIASTAVIGCGGGGSSGSTGGGSNGGGGSSLLAATDVNIGNITTIPTGSNSTNTSVVVTNNSSDSMTLQSATYKLYAGGNQSEQSTSVANSPVNVAQCTTVQARGTCSVGVRAPDGETQGQYLLTMNFLDGKTGKTHTTSQIISYSADVPTINGVKYSTLNNNLYNQKNGSTTLSIPFVLQKDFTSLSVKSDRDNPVFAPTISCPDNSYTAGTLCTVYVKISNSGTSDVIAGGITVSEGLSSSKVAINKSKAMKLLGGTAGYVFGVPITVTQMLSGNLITSGINVVINPSDGTSAQTITLLNNGNATLSGISVIGASPITVSSNGCSSLAANASCTFSVNVTSTTSGQSSVTVNYNNGASSGNTSGTLSFNVIYISSPDAPAMTMTSGQGSLLNTPINTTQLYTILVKNTSTTTTFNNIKFTDPSITSPALSWDTTDSTCKIDGTQSLPPASSGNNSACTLVLQYSPTAVTAPSNFTLREAADYGSSGNTYTGARLDISYSAITGSALLYITPNYVSFAIRADGHDSVTQTFSVVNAGLQAATLNTIGNSPSVTAFNITGGTCAAGSTNLNVGESCTITTQFGSTTSTITNESSTLAVGYRPDGSHTTDVTAFSNLVFNSSNAAYVNISNIAVTNTTSGAGTSGSAYQFTNSPASNSQITFVITYANTGTANATNFNVALNNLPVGYVVVGGSTTCGYGSTTSTLAATTGTCTVGFKAVDPSGLYNPYALSGVLNVNIPGFSYLDTNTGLNTQAFPTWSGHYGNANTMYVTANLFANVTTTVPTWTTANAGGTNNFTFTGTPNGTVITIPAGQFSGVNSSITFPSGRTCTITAGSCIIPISNAAGSATPAAGYHFSYTVAPASVPGSGITQQATFILN